MGLPRRGPSAARLFARERNTPTGEKGQGQKLEASLLGTGLLMLGMRFVRIDGIDKGPHTEIMESVDAMRAAGTPYPDLLEVYEAQHFPVARQHLLPVSTRPPTA